MSFSFAVTVENGTATVTQQSTGDAAPPDGIFNIGGHQGSGWTSLNIGHAKVGSASAHVWHPQPEQES